MNTIEQLESGLITGEITEMQMLHPLDIESRPPPGGHTVEEIAGAASRVRVAQQASSLENDVVTRE